MPPIIFVLLHYLCSRHSTWMIRFIFSSTKHAGVNRGSNCYTEKHLYAHTVLQTSGRNIKEIAEKTPNYSSGTDLYTHTCSLQRLHLFISRWHTTVYIFFWKLGEVAWHSNSCNSGFPVKCMYYLFLGTPSYLPTNILLILYIPHYDHSPPPTPQHKRFDKKSYEKPTILNTKEGEGEMHIVRNSKVSLRVFLTPLLTFLPRIWLMAADSLRVHSAITFGLISFMNNIKAFSGFFT